ncbi:hypothetical protein L873DRAFT_1170565 [Choiromyces venosus 120613-1]|uniref:Uncharacterized protein n=1 Tax=Choiromyces venosus 120613-1 TaxID=1336337 RepID=A0A3N4K5J1_9PEZI|nr:hypothetical protein L873DRAFT_1170565 [Choiromyces venosus 120613-1]
MRKHRPTMISLTPMNLPSPTTPRRLTSSDSRPLPLRIPGSSVKVRSLITYFNQKIHEKAAPVTSTPHHHHDWKAIPSGGVRSLVLNFSRVGIALPGSNSRISIVSPVTIDGGYSRAGRMAAMTGVDSNGAVFGGKGEGEKGRRVSVRSASLQVDDIPSYAMISSSGSTGDGDGSTSDDIRVSDYRKLDALQTMKGWKEGKKSRRGRSGSIGGQSTVAKKSMRRKKGSVKSPEYESANNRPVKDTTTSVRGRLLGRSEEPDDRLLRGLQGLAQRESLRSSSLEVDPTDTDSPSSLSALAAQAAAAAAENEADAEIKSPETGDIVSDSVSKRSFSGSIGSTFRSIRDSFRKKASPQKMSPATAAMTGGVSEPVGRTSEPAGNMSGLTVDKAVSSSTMGGDVAGTGATYLIARESFLQSRRSSSARSVASRVRYEIRKLEKLETLHSETEGGNSSGREVLTGTVLDKVLDVKKALEAASSQAQIGERDRGRLPRPSPRNEPIVGPVARSRRLSASYRAGSSRPRAGRKPVAGTSPRSPPTGSPLRSPVLTASPIQLLRVFKAGGETPVVAAAMGGKLIESAARAEKREALNAADRGDDDISSSRDVPSNRSRSGDFAGARRERSRSPTPPLGAVEANPVFGTVLSSPGNVTESPESITPQDRPQVPVRSPSLMREMAFPSLSVRGEVAPSEEPAGKLSTSERRKSTASREITREVPKRKIVQDGQWIMDQKTLGEGGRIVTNLGIKKIRTELDQHSYDDQTSSSKSGVLQLASKANSTGANSYNMLPPPELPLGSSFADKYVVVDAEDEDEENGQYQDYIIEPEQARPSSFPSSRLVRKKYAVNTTTLPMQRKAPDRLSGGMYYPPFQEWSKDYEPQPIIEGVLSGNNGRLDGSAGGGGGSGGWRSLKNDNEQFRRGRKRERVNWAV